MGRKPKWLMAMIEALEHPELQRPERPRPERQRHSNTTKDNRPRCGAKRRDGRDCRASAVWDRLANKPLQGGRCRVHGGPSTGPRTEAGKAAIAASNRRRA